VAVHSCYPWAGDVAARDWPIAPSQPDADADGVWLAFARLVDSGRPASDGAAALPALVGTAAVAPLPLVLFGGERFAPMPLLHAALVDDWICATDRHGGEAVAAVAAVRPAVAAALELSAADPAAAASSPAVASLVGALHALLAEDEAARAAKPRRAASACGHGGPGAGEGRRRARRRRGGDARNEWR